MTHGLSTSAAKVDEVVVAVADDGGMPIKGTGVGEGVTGVGGGFTTDGQQSNSTISR